MASEYVPGSGSGVRDATLTEAAAVLVASMLLCERIGIMVPSDFSNFFLASTGAGGALVGLLFVAIAVAPERIFGRDALPERQVVAASAFSALVNAFIVSLTALIPRMNVGGVAIVMGVLALFTTAQQVRKLWDRRIGAVQLARRMSLPVSSLVIYGLEIDFGISLIQHGTAVEPIFSLSILLLVIFGVGLTRAWQLLGAPRTGVFSWLFEPFKSIREDEEQGSGQVSATSDADRRLPQGMPVGTQPRRDAGQSGR